MDKMAKNNLDTGAAIPSTDAWLKEAKTDGSAKQCGMYLFHNGVVRETAKAKVRQGADIEEPVVRMEFSYEEEKVREAIAKAYELPGIYYVKVWLNQGTLSVGDDIMLVLIGGDIRPHVIDALQSLVGKIKNHCVTETEKF